MKERRTPLEIYYDILKAISDKEDVGKLINLKLTKLQLIVGMSYDKIKLYYDFLVKKEMLLPDTFCITSKGNLFIQECDILFKYEKRAKQRIESYNETEITKIARLPVSREHKEKDCLQVNRALSAIIQELEN